MQKRDILVFSALLAIIFFTGILQGWSSTLSILTVGLISAVLALGLNIQWGYAGLFNAGVMAFTAIGAIACVLISMPWVTSTMIASLATLQESPEINQQAINQLQIDIPRRLSAEYQLLWAWFIGAITAIASWLINKNLQNSLSARYRFFLICIVLISGVTIFRYLSGPATSVIESTGFGNHSKYLGGLELPILFAWCVGGLFATGAAWIIGKIALGLRSDSLAIATLGISEIVIALLKNENWLTPYTAVALIELYSGKIDQACSRLEKMNKITNNASQEISYKALIQHSCGELSGAKSSYEKI